MSDNLLGILKLCLLGLLYLFFLRVLRVVWVELRPPVARGSRADRATEVIPADVAAAAMAATAANAATKSGKPAKAAKPARGRRSRHAAPGTLQVIEPPEQRGRSFELGPELTVGRAPGCQVTLDDTFASQLHARLFRRDGQLFVEDLGSTNGTYVNRERVVGAVALKRGDALQVGRTVMEVG